MRRKKASNESILFVLGASGHIAGVINPATKNKRSYWTNNRKTKKASADEWLATAKEVKGSWWTLWSEWLSAFGGGAIAAPHRLGSADFSVIEDAPGSYVKEKA